MSYFQQEIPPVRDQRLTIGDSFSGCGKGMLDCARSGCLLQKNRSFWQTGSCQMALSLMMASTIENAIIVMHGPIGCGSQLHSLIPQTNKGKAKRGKTPKPFAWLSTNLQEADVISGGGQKLIETIEYADREFRPEIIFVVSTCAPSIIGDDVEEIVRRVQSNVAAYVTAIHCPGFKTRVVASAYDSFYHSLLKHIPFEPQERIFEEDIISNTERELANIVYHHKKSRTVNLFNATSIGPGDEEELIRLLEALDLKVQVYTEYSSLEEFRNMNQAALNISMCSVHDDYLLKYLKETYDIPCIIHGMPIGLKATRQWLLAVAEHFGLEEKATRIADFEEKMVNSAIEPLLPKLKGKRVLICGGVVRVGEEAQLLKYLGLDIIAVRAYHYDNGAEGVYEKFSKELPKSSLSISNQLFELANQIAHYKPDLVISHAGTQGWLSKMGATSIQLFNVDNTFFGYTGLYSIVKRILFAFDNPAFQDRLSKHIKLPYKESWYERDAFSYIKN